MKKKIIKNILFILLALVLILPFTSAKILLASGIHEPTLKPFPSDWQIVSLFGPRYLSGAGTKFHEGIDFSPLKENKDLGYMIKSRTNGTIINFVKGTSGGWKLQVQPPSDIRSLHGANDFFYMHLFQNDGTVPSIQKTKAGYTKVEVVTVSKTKKIDGKNITRNCKGIAFWSDDVTLDKVLTRKRCNGFIYRSHTDKPAKSKVEIDEEIAPMGNSGTEEAHLHFGMNFGAGIGNRDNPFYALKRTDAPPGEWYFDADILKDSADSSKLLSKSGFWIDVYTQNEYSLDKVDLKLIKSDGAMESLPGFSFGGRPGESRVNLTDDPIRKPSDPACESLPTESYSEPITQACKWSGTPNQRKWRFFVPYDIASLPSGEHKLCTKMTSVNGYANTADTCESFIINDCPDPDNPKIGDKCHGGIVFYVDGTGKHGLVAATNDIGIQMPWEPGPCCFFALIGTTDGIGAGKTNTDTIIAAFGSGSAAYAARNYNGGGYTDWYLPSKYELNLLYLHKGVLGGLWGYGYWSSTEYVSEFEWSKYYAWIQDLSSGGQEFGYKLYKGRVRAVRAF